MTSCARKPVLVEILIIEVDVAVGIREHFLIRSKGQVRGISRLDGLLVGSAQASDRARPTDCPVILIIELYSETSRIITFLGVHERRNVSVVEKPLIIDTRLSDK